MKSIDKKELYDNLGNFLKTKGIELKDGSYAAGIEKACSFLTDAINLGQMGLERAKEGLDRKVDQVRAVIHEKTAPKTSVNSPAEPCAEAAAPGAASSSSESSQPANARAKAKPQKGRPSKAVKGRKSRRSR